MLRTNIKTLLHILNTCRPVRGYIINECHLAISYAQRARVMIYTALFLYYTRHVIDSRTRFRTHAFLTVKNGCSKTTPVFIGSMHWVGIRCYTCMRAYTDCAAANRRLFYRADNCHTPPRFQWPANNNNNNSHEVASTKEPACAYMETRRRRRSQWTR